MGILREITSMSAVAGWMVCVLIVMLGAISCFLGYRLVKFWIGMLGFALGLIGGYTLGGWFVNNPWIPLAIGVVLGIILAFVAYKLYLASVFLLCGGLACLVFGTLLRNGEWWVYLVAAIAGIAVGVIAIYFVKPVVIVSTSFHGASNIVMAVGTMFGVDKNWIIYIVVLVVAVVGIVVQIHTTKDKQEKEGLAYAERKNRYDERQQKKDEQTAADSVVQQNPQPAQMQPQQQNPQPTHMQPAQIQPQQMQPQQGQYPQQMQSTDAAQPVDMVQQPVETQPEAAPQQPADTNTEKEV